MSTKVQNVALPISDRDGVAGWREMGWDGRDGRDGMRLLGCRETGSDGILHIQSNPIIRHNKDQHPDLLGARTALQLSSCSASATDGKRMLPLPNSHQQCDGTGCLSDVTWDGGHAERGAVE